MVADGRARRHPVRRLGADQPRPGAAGRRRLLGPGAARPVDPRLHPARRACAREGSRRTAPTPSAPGKACVGYLTMPLPGGAIAHIHVNWLSPTKIRQMVIGGSRRTAGLGRPQPAAAAVASTTGAWTSTSAADSADLAERRAVSDLLPARGHARARRCPSARRCGAMVARVRRRRSARVGAAHRRRGGPAGAVRAGGGHATSLATQAAVVPWRSVADLAPSAPVEAVVMTTLRGCLGPRHRWGRHDRLHDRRPAPRRGRRPRRRPGQPGARPAREPRPAPARRGKVDARRGRPARPRPRARRDARARTSSSTRPRSGSPSAPRSHGSPSRCSWTARSTCSRRLPSTSVDKLVAASSASVYGLAEQLPHGRAAPPPQQRHVLRCGEVLQRGHGCAASGRCTGSTTWRCATSTSTGRGWTSTASTPRCSSAGWSASPTGSRR